MEKVIQMDYGTVDPPDRVWETCFVYYKESVYAFQGSLPHNNSSRISAWNFGTCSHVRDLPGVEVSALLFRL